MKFDRSLTNFVEKNVYYDLESINIFDFYYSEFYFRTTKELIMYKSILKSKMIKSHSTSINLSLITLFFSFSINFVLLFKDILLKQTDVANETAITVLLGVFLGVFILLVFIDRRDDSTTNKNKKLFLMVEAIDKILSERKDNEN